MQTRNDAVLDELLERFQSLEESQAKLREEISELVEEKNNKEDVKEMEEEEDEVVVGMTSDISCIERLERPYKSVVDCIGHAVHVCSYSNGEILYWNRSAENLYGWKSYEALGQNFAQLLVLEQHHSPLKEVIEHLRTGQSWSGQFPFKKKNGEIFMAIATNSPLYEDGELVGIIIVSSDAATFNSGNSENQRFHQQHGRLPRINLRKIQWHPRAPIAPMPQIASSVSNLASKLLSRKHTDEANTTEAQFGDNEHTARDSEGASSKIHSRLAAKVLAKLNIGGIGNTAKDDCIGDNHSGPRDSSPKNEQETSISLKSKVSFFFRSKSDNEDQKEVNHKRNPSFSDKRLHLDTHGNREPKLCEEGCIVASSTECMECFECAKQRDVSLRLNCQEGANEMEPEVLEVETEAQRPSECKQHSSLGLSTGSSGSSLSKGGNEACSDVECEIQWEDLQLKEEIGQGSYAVVYRGIWNGSDVAVKVYFGNEYEEETLEAYEKEVEIMKKLRHPNVLLFMGAVYSPERLAMVTEFLPRGSLFRALHKSSQALDIKRRLRMALDVTRGMNYLHHRNPPIIHRDLKSSNLLVGKNWTVKVGDFGLSRWKNATFLTAKSGRGTPQWMAPEVLRNEPSNEKSDVFSFGVILWELMTVSVPWANLNSLQVVGVVGFMDRRLELPEGLDPRIVSIIRDCWQSDPGNRPSFEDLIHRMSSIVQKVSPPTPIQRNQER